MAYNARGHQIVQSIHRNCHNNIILKKVDSVAELVLHITLGTLVGPIFLGPESLVISKALNKFFVDGPPDPIISPVIGLEILFSSRPESSIASTIAR